jgi:hypothetical protein
MGMDQMVLARAAACSSSVGGGYVTGSPTYSSAARFFVFNIDNRP